MCAGVKPISYPNKPPSITSNPSITPKILFLPYPFPHSLLALSHLARGRFPQGPYAVCASRLPQRNRTSSFKGVVWNTGRKTTVTRLRQQVQDLPHSQLSFS